MSTINTLPDSFNSLIQNLKTVLVDPASDLGSNLELIPKAENRSFKNFDELVKKTEELFFCFLEKSTFSDKKNEYVPGRISVRLERIAQSQYGLSLKESQEVMKPFMEKVLIELKQHLPSNTVFFKPAALQEKNNKERPPFFQEAQQTVMSCQLHAFNAVLGYAAADLSSPEFGLLNTDSEGINCKIINRVTKKNAMIVPVKDFMNKKLYEKHSAFMAGNGVHGFAYRKDQDGQWWKVDSLYKVSEWTYQTSVDLSEEENAWAETRLVMENISQLKTLLKDELTEFSHRLANIQTKHLIDKETVDVISLKNDLTECVRFIIFSANFCRLEEVYTDQPLMDDHLTLLQGITRDESKLLETISDVNLAIRSKNIDINQFKAKLDTAQMMIANALASLDK